MRLVAALIAATVSPACFQTTAVLKVNGNGGGTIEHRTLMTSAGLAQMRQLSGVLGGNSGAPIEPFSEQEARDLAGKLGDGVTVQSTAPIKTAAGEGRTTVYSFRDITQLRFDEILQMPGDPSVRAGGATAAGSPGQVRFDLAPTGSGNVLLTLHGPEPALGKLGAAGGSVPSVDQLAMLRQTLAGLRVAVRVEPAGTLVRTNGRFVEGASVTIFDLDLDELLKDDTVFARLQSVKTSDELEAALKSTRGLKLDVGTVTIEFTPAK
ncbi:MAG: hypothetical protein C5B57_03800 [Blastocatellia bacterium]|nr:MAG: hypothetical protein C5B57_03800 [Blastocatellia bacterium]